MSLQSFKNIFKEFPKLNSTDETKGLEGFLNLANKLQNRLE